MTRPATLFELAGRKLAPHRLGEAALVLIDFQNEYLDGPLAVAGAEAAIANAARLLDVARAVGAPVLHIAHKGPAGGLFDRAARRGAIVDALQPRAGEEVIEKPRPNALSGATLQERLATLGNPPLVIAGFMTHMCVSSTARAALDFGLAVTVVSDACGTRDLPGVSGGVLPAPVLHEAELAALADRFACVATTQETLASARLVEAVGA